MKIKLLIDGVDRTANMTERGWSIDDNDGDLIDVVEVEIEDPDLTITIPKDKDLIIEDDADSTVRYFGGIITEVASETLDGIGRIYNITAQDWKVILDRAHFSLIRINKNDSAIIADSFSEAGITEINSTDLVQTGRQINHLVFRGATLRNMMDAITQITGFFWDVDKFKKLIYRPYGNVAASFNFSDNPDDVATFPYYNFFRTESIAQFHCVRIHGGERLTQVTDVYSGDGIRTRFALRIDGTTTDIDSTIRTYHLIFRGREGDDPDIPLIERNTGTNASPVYTVQTVGIEGQDTGKDVVWNPATHEVDWGIAPPNFANNSWRITGRYIGSAAFEQCDESAVDDAGRKFTKVLVLPEVEDDDQAMDIADAFLREQGAKDLLRFNFTKDGLVVGDSVKITNTPHALTAKDYYVHNLGMRGLGGQVYEYSVVVRNAP